MNKLEPSGVSGRGLWLASRCQKPGGGSTGGVCVVKAASPGSCGDAVEGKSSVLQRPASSMHPRDRSRLPRQVATTYVPSPGIRAIIMRDRADDEVFVCVPSARKL